MKKSTKTTTSSQSRSARPQRRAAGKTKPVTIDLKAEEVAEAKPDTEAKKTASAKSRTATPKVKKAAPTKTAAASPTSSVAKEKTDQQSSFGRNATPSNGKSPEPKTASQTKAKKEPKPKSGNMGKFAAALIGGVVALGGAGLLQNGGILPAPNQVDMTGLQQQVAGDTNALRTELNALSAKVSSIPTANQSIDESVLASQVDSLVTKRLAELPPSTGDSDLDAVITQVNETTIRVEKLLADQQASTQTLSELKSAINSGSAGDGAAISALSLQVENLASQSSKLGDDLDLLKSQMADLAKQSSAQSATLTSDLEKRLSSLEGQAQDLPQLTAALGDLQKAIDTNSQNLQLQSSNVEELAASVNKPDSSAQMVARAVAAAALKNDIDRGLPFESSLQVLQNLAAGDASLDPLASYAQTGIPTSAQLAASFTKVSDDILAATQPAPSDDLSSRLMAGMKSFVKVKPRKALEGTTPIAIVSQISQSLQDGSLNRASDLWQSLPEAGRFVSTQWHEQLKSRITADGLISSSVQSFLNSTATQ